MSSERQGAPRIINPEEAHQQAVEDTKNLFGSMSNAGERRGDFGIVTFLGHNDDTSIVCKTDARWDIGEDLMHEALVESVLQKTEGSPLQLPQFEDLSRISGSYRMRLAKGYIEGAPLNDETIKSIAEHTQVTMGKKVAQFVAWMGEVLPPDDYIQLTEDVDFKRVDIFTKWWNEDLPIYDLIPPEQEGYRKLAEYLEYQYHSMDGQQDLLQDTMIGHRDLRPDGNLIFQNEELVGVIDFGAAGPSTPELELRHLAPYGCALEAAADEFHQLTGYPIDPHKAKVFGSMHAFLNIVARATRLKERRVGYDLRLNYLREQYPGFDLPDMLEK